MTTLDDPLNLPNPSEVSPRPTAIRYGFYWGLVGIAYGLVGYLTGMTVPSAEGGAAGTLNWVIGLVIMVAFLFLAIKHHRDQELGGFISYGRCIGVGALTALVYGVIIAVWTIIFMQFIAPDFFDQLIEGLTSQWENQGMGEDQIEQALKFTKMFQNPIVSGIWSLIMAVFMATTVSLILGAIMKKIRPGL